MDEQAEAITNMLSRRLFVELEASGRHVHVTKEQAVALFGHDLTPRRPLSQPGQYLASERVTVKTDKGEIARVAVLGPHGTGRHSALRCLVSSLGRQGVLKSPKAAFLDLSRYSAAGSE